jgi:hypothetical protein
MVGLRQINGLLDIAFAAIGSLGELRLAAAAGLDIDAMRVNASFGIDQAEDGARVVSDMVGLAISSRATSILLPASSA